MLRKIITFICIVFCGANLVFGQTAIHEWTTHAPGMHIINVEKVHDRIYAATPYELFYYNTTDNSINKLTKVNALSDFGISVMRYNQKSDMIFIGYSNANIDIINKEGNVINLNDIKNKNILADKNINDVYFIDDLAYVSCGFGIVVINLKKMEVKDTYVIGDNASYISVNDITLFDDKLYAATNSGVYYADYNNPNLADFSQWTHDNSMIHDKLNYSEIEAFNGKLYANYSSNSYNKDTLFVYENGKWDYMTKAGHSIKRDLKAYDDRLIITEHYSVKVFGKNNNIIFNQYTYIEPYATIYDKNENVYWMGDKKRSLLKVYPDKTIETITFNGPYSTSSFEIEAKGDQVWVVGGGYTSTWAKRWMKEGIYCYHNNEWTNFNYSNTEALDTITDLVTVAIDPTNNSKVYVGSYDKGLLYFENFKLKEIYDETNSSLDLLTGYDYVYVTGLDFDNNNNLWVANHGTDKMLSVKTTDNKWYSFNIGNHYISHLLVDNNNYKWILNRDGNIIVFNDNNTIPNSSDDRYKIIKNIAGQGGLPERANCMAVDKNGAVWVGTNDGLAIFYSTSRIFQQGANYDAARILVPRNDGSGQADYLLSGESVISITIDDANNLWVGTKNGAFYISNNGMTEYYHFTQDNSPLLSNNVQSIAIDAEGMVYFATDKGIISFKGRSTEAKKHNSDVMVYPNPVRSGYSGVVGIKNLMANTLVKITTVDGSFVTHLYSEGGQAIWDCTNIKGENVSPGIYLIFVSDSSGNETFATKILIQ